MPISEHQKRTLLCSNTRTSKGAAEDAGTGWEDMFTWLQNNQRLGLDLGAQDIIWYPEKMPLFTDLQRGRSSKLRRFMEENDGWPVLVVDEFLPGKDSLFLVRSFEGDQGLLTCLTGVQWVHGHVRIHPLGPDFRVVAISLNSYAL